MYPPQHDRGSTRRREGGEEQVVCKDQEDTKPKEEEEVDEFGRTIKKRKSTNDKDQDSSKKSRREWPPPFDETNGSEYVLDSGSGMFYHADCDFFYDPQTKLYYGNKQACYFRYEPANDPDTAKDKEEDDDEKTKNKETRNKSRFVPISQSSGKDLATTTKDLDVLLDTSKSRTTTSSKSSISITLKTKKLPKSNHGNPNKPKAVSKTDVASDPSSTDQNSNPLQRQHHMDMSKWSERLEERKQQEDSGPTATTKRESTKDDKPTESTNTATNKKIARTAKGEPMCVLCQRKFPTVEKLRYHERVSKLHAENLKKKTKKEKDTTVTESTMKREEKYIDRAQQRRALYGDDDAALAPAVTTVPAMESSTTLSSSSSTAPVEAHAPTELLGTHTVGNQLLQKLGWKTGQAIGRRQQQQEEEDSSNAQPASRQTDRALRKEWERIEALAASQQRK